MKSLLCRIGLHHWDYLPNTDAFGEPCGGKPMFRTCSRCQQRQSWNYELARTRGLIAWENLPPSIPENQHAH